eukprot:1189812-Prorocentrum_minimum.AAC.1
MTALEVQVRCPAALLKEASREAQAALTKRLHAALVSALVSGHLPPEDGGGGDFAAGVAARVVMVGAGVAIVDLTGLAGAERRARSVLEGCQREGMEAQGGLGPSTLLARMVRPSNMTTSADP